jgi:hypothetical protein
MFARIAIGAVLVALFAYGLMEARPLLLGPHLTVSSPADFSTFPDGFVEVAGTAVRTQTLTLDGAPLLIDESGKFYTLLTLPSGGAILSLTAKDRFGRTHTVTRHVLVR